MAAALHFSAESAGESEYLVIPDGQFYGQICRDLKKPPFILSFARKGDNILSTGFPSIVHTINPENQ